MKKTLLLAFCCASVLSACVISQDEYPLDYSDSVCPEGFVETPNTGRGDSSICCPAGTIGIDGLCVDEPDSFAFNSDGYPEPEDIVAQGVTLEGTTVNLKNKETYVLLSAPNGRGSAYCPGRSNSLAWNGSEFKCCGKGMKAVVIESRDDSICCPTSSTHARWVGMKWNDYECCPEGTIEVKNVGEGGKYACCPKGYKAVNGGCFPSK